MAMLQVQNLIGLVLHMALHEKEIIRLEEEVKERYNEIATLKDDFLLEQPFVYSEG